jgi:hypothetical protein
MCDRVYALCTLGKAVDDAKTPGVKTRLLKAMDAVIYSIDPPRGQLHAVAKTGESPVRLVRD